MDWGESKTYKGVTERDFSVRCEDRNIPGVLWTPEGATAGVPLVLIGHGGNGHKREDHLNALARRFVRHNAIAAATIDGPIHGDREPEEIRCAPFEERRKHLVGDRVTDEMVQDWKATLDALQKLPEIGSIEKSLHANPGLHSAVPRAELLNTQDFLARHLSRQDV